MRQIPGRVEGEPTDELRISTKAFAREVLDEVVSGVVVPANRLAERADGFGGGIGATSSGGRRFLRRCGLFLEAQDSEAPRRQLASRSRAMRTRSACVFKAMPATHSG